MCVEGPAACPLTQAAKNIRVSQSQTVLASNIAKLLNSWLSRKQIPTVHSTSRLLLIAKKPIDRQEGNTLDEFRPIAVTSVFFKLLEVIVRTRI
jgi:hypothetical protein